MKNYLLSFSVVLICAVAVYTQNSATSPPQSDFQFWNETQIIFPLVQKTDEKGKKSDRLAFFITGTLRLGRDYTHLVDRRIGFGFDWKINKFFTFTPAYFYRAGEPYQNRREFESRLRFALSFEKKFQRFTFKDRNLIEHRLRNLRPDTTRYRQRVNFTFPITRANKEIFAPFVQDEIFYDFNQKHFSRNELSFGITRKFNPHLSADFFYLWQRNRGDILRHIQALGINLKIRVD